MSPMAHAVDDMNDWYINRWADRERAEALAYGMENLLRRLDGPLAWVDDLRLTRSCRRARDYWEAGWRDLGVNLFTGRVRWGRWARRPAERALRPEDIQDVMEKFGIHISCSELKPIYERWLAEHGVTADLVFNANGTINEAASGGILYQNGRVRCVCRLTCDFADFELPDIFR